MKSAQLPPVRVTPEVRQQIEDCLRPGESMSEFVQGAVSAAASARKAQDEFIARGRASVAQARTSNEFYSAREALTEMTQRLTAKAKTHGKKKSLARP